MGFSIVVHCGSINCISDFIIFMSPLLGIFIASTSVLEGGVLDDWTDIWSLASLRLDAALEGLSALSIDGKLEDFRDKLDNI